MLTSEGNSLHRHPLAIPPRSRVRLGLVLIKSDWIWMYPPCKKKLHAAGRPCISDPRVPIYGSIR